MLNTADRVIFLDYLKVIAIVMVVLFHCGVGGLVPRTLYSICCPLFFAVNGYLMFSRERPIEVMVSKSLKIFLLICFWAIFGTSQIMLLKGERDAVAFIRNLYWMRIGYCNHLWFLAALFTLNIFYVLLFRIMQMPIKWTYLFLGFLALCTLDVPKYLTWVFNPFEGWLYRFSLFYFVMGGFFCRVDARRIPYFLLLLIFVAALAIKTYLNRDLTYDITFAGYSSVFTALMVICLMILLSKVNPKRNVFIEYLSSITLDIYLIHAPFFLSLRLIAPNFMQCSNIIFAMFVFASSVLITFVLKRYKYTRFLITL